MRENQNIRVAICGQLRSGKDTVGRLIAERLNAKHFAFSDGVWQALRILFPETYEQRHVQKPRKALQDVGQGLRQIHPKIWIEYTLRQVAEAGSENIIITDLRQPNELEALVDAGFHIVRVHTDMDIRKERAEAAGDVFDESSMQHETELHVEHFDVDFEIDNNGTIDELHDKVDAVLSKIEGGSK